MGLGFVNTDCFHDLLVRTINLYWTEVSSLIFLQPQANGLPPREQRVHATQADDCNWSFLIRCVTRYMRFYEMTFQKLMNGVRLESFFSRFIF
jgi:hypothetical protein